MGWSTFLEMSFHLCLLTRMATWQVPNTFGRTGYAQKTRLSYLAFPAYSRLLFLGSLLLALFFYCEILSIVAWFPAISPFSYPFRTHASRPFVPCFLYLSGPPVRPGSQPFRSPQIPKPYELKEPGKFSFLCPYLLLRDHVIVSEMSELISWLRNSILSFRQVN